jgi:hypothetical protein
MAGNAVAILSDILLAALIKSFRISSFIIIIVVAATTAGLVH